MITAKKINKLSQRKDVKPIAVKSFLRSLGEKSERNKQGALTSFASRRKRWNSATRRAILAGIRTHFKS